MTASLALLPLLLAAPLAGQSGSLSARLAQAGEAAPAPDPQAPAEAAPSEPSDPAPPDAATPPTAAPEAPATPPAATPAPAPAQRPPPAAPARSRFTSLLGAETLGGTSAAAAWAGWSSLGAAWAMGVAPEDDLGALADYDWAKSELRLGGLYRRGLSSIATGGYDLALRVTLSFYANLGSTWVYSDNHSEHGVEVAPGLVYSLRAAGGLLSASADGPLTVTTKYRTGLLFSPRVGLAFETPLYQGVTVGARIGAGYRAGSGDAPLRTGRGELQFLVLAGYQLL